MARPKGSSNKVDKASLKAAWEAICQEKPWLIKEAFIRGLQGGRPLGFLELGARLMKEVGVQEGNKPQIAIIFNGGLDANKLKGVTQNVNVIDIATVNNALPQHILEKEIEDGDFPDYSAN